MTRTEARERLLRRLLGLIEEHGGAPNQFWLNRELYGLSQEERAVIRSHADGGGIVKVGAHLVSFEKRAGAWVAIVRGEVTAIGAQVPIDGTR